MIRTDRVLTPSEAAKTLGVSTKALRLYEARGLVTPSRTAAGWRAYGPEALRRAAEIVELRGLGLRLADIARLIDADPATRHDLLSAHLRRLQHQREDLLLSIGQLRHHLAARADETRLDPDPCSGPAAIAFDLPWPWNGERFTLPVLGALTFVVGPLGSGKTRLARLISEHLPETRFLPMERVNEEPADLRARLAAVPALRSRVADSLAALIADGAVASHAMVALVAGLEADPAATVVIDTAEHRLDAASQKALARFLRVRISSGRRFVLLTRSTALLDLDTLAPEATILFCPANHDTPIVVRPYPEAAGYEALKSCLAAPEVRARTEGVVARRASAPA
ncbi:MerR family transcriptional regulator [Amorphus orientalis]|uniref:DNA-binding transcriptional MerR regulator n=1 Tax=Amorphus orientalis TaxID=649198 RepID=A0AAE3VQ09_9HYPH|nr:MerR family transcriptional regulator [Amorphus orientalis]MDQ0315933.1 DNA-binding transcriptional MerR regulator [Amorphus orientalis]